jgi:hypothetical protein
MASAINNLITNPQRMASMHSACLTAALELNWEVEGEKLLGAYTRLPIMKNIPVKRSTSPTNS